MEQQTEPGPSRTGISAHTVQAGVGVLLGLIGVVVMVESRRLGAGWTADGPGAGYFPFLIGLLLAVASAGIVYEALGPRRRQPGVFADRQQLRRVGSVLGPALVYVLAVQGLGLYLASAAYIALFMRVLGRYRWSRSLLVAVAVSGLLFCLFELWFKLPLFKGWFDPLQWLGRL